MDKAMLQLGLKETTAGSWLCVSKAIESLIEQLEAKPRHGKYFIQVMADAVRVYRNTAFTVVAIRVLQDVVDFNPMTSICVL